MDSVGSGRFVEFRVPTQPSRCPTRSPLRPGHDLISRYPDIPKHGLRELLEMFGHFSRAASHHVTMSSSFGNHGISVATPTHAARHPAPTAKGVNGDGGLSSTLLLPIAFVAILSSSYHDVTAECLHLSHGQLQMQSRGVVKMVVLDTHARSSQPVISC